MHDIPPNALPTAAVYPADLAKNIWELEFSLPRATWFSPGGLKPGVIPDSATSATNLVLYPDLKLAPMTPGVPTGPSGPASAVNPYIYLIGTSIPPWATNAPVIGPTGVIPTLGARSRARSPERSPVTG